MQQPVKSVTEQTTLLEIAQLMLEHRIGSVLVVDGTGVLKGIITETDFAAKEKGIPFSTFRGPQLFHQWMDGSNLEELYREARTLTAGEIMTHHEHGAGVSADDGRTCLPCAGCERRKAGGDHRPP
jgi:CBS-domain-containing membrane protein